MWRFMPTSFPFDLYGGWFHPVGHFGVLSAKGKGIEAYAGNAGLRGVPRISQQLEVLPWNSGNGGRLHLQMVLCPWGNCCAR